MTEFCTQVHGGKAYQITVKTDNKEHYFRIQQAARECVDNTTTVDAAPVVRGKWERCVEDWREQIEGDACSLCGFEHYGARYNYCPNCGAKMDGGRV